MPNEYVYYFKASADSIEDIALIRNRKLTSDELATLKTAIEADGGIYTRLVEYVGYEMPNFAQCVNA